MPPTPEQLQLVREAMQRRMTDNGAPAGGNPVPAVAQATPMAPGTPPAAPTTPAQPNLNSLPVTPQASNTANPDVSAMTKLGQQAQNPNFDDETRKIAKALVSKLIGVL